MRTRQHHPGSGRRIGDFLRGRSGRSPRSAESCCTRIFLGEGGRGIDRPTDAAERFRKAQGRLLPSLGRRRGSSTDDESDDSMIDTKARGLRRRGTLPFPQRSPQEARRGFSRPRLAAGDPHVHRAEARSDPESTTATLDWLLLELHALALDCERARAYLSQPGCNVLLGQAQLSRTMVKRSRILRFLRDGHRPVDPFHFKAGAARRWATRGGRS
jgi:hypothetical protein